MVLLGRTHATEVTTSGHRGETLGGAERLIQEHLPRRAPTPDFAPSVEGVK